MNINTYHYRSWAGLVQKQRKESLFVDSSIAYVPEDVIQEMSVRLETLDRATPIAVLYTIEWVIYLLHMGFKNVTIATDKYDKSIGVWANLI